VVFIGFSAVFLQISADFISFIYSYLFTLCSGCAKLIVNISSYGDFMKKGTVENISAALANYDIKQINRRNVLKLFCAHEHLSRRDIQKHLGLSIPTITQNILELTELGLIQKSGITSYTGGRKAEVFSLDPSSRIAVGLDITKHHATIVLVDLLGRVIAEKRIRIPYQKDETYFKTLKIHIHDILEQNKIAHTAVLGVGFGVPVLTDITNSYVTYARILDMNGITAEQISDYVGFDTLLCNTSNASAFAELYNVDNYDEIGFYIMLSSNVGGAVFMDNAIYPGDNFRSGEVGHMILHPGGEMCYCGQAGCMDPYCSSTVLSDLTNGDLDLFFDILESGNPKFQAVWDKYLQNLALAIRNVRILFDCQIIIGGYIGAKIDPYMPRIRELLNQYNTFDSNYDFVKPCRYKKAAIAAGSAMLFISDFLETV